MKQRFSSLDVKVIAHELSKSLCSLRVTNIYDLSSRIFLFKFHKPDHREQLIVDSGFRCHLTSYARSTAAAPSPFVARLRKYLKTRRVTSVSQIGTDRIIEFQFSDGLYRIYLEFYAGGNIVLTDGDLNILAILRSVDEGAEHEKLRVGLQYNLSLRQNYGGVPPLTKERIKEGLRKAIERQQDTEATGKKAKKPSRDALRKALAVSMTEYPPLLIDHAMNLVKFDGSLKPDQVFEDESLLDKLLLVLEEAKKISEEITSLDTAKGYILAKPNPAFTTPQEEAPEIEGGNKASRLLYDDFHPFRPRQFENSEYTFLEFDGFNKTVDEFFSSIEGQKLESRLHEREMNAKKKLDHARQEHAKRIGGLQQVQELNFRKAEAIGANIDRVQEAIVAVNGLIGQGMDWVEIAHLIEREQAQRNAVAQLIKLPLKLHENTITLLLDEPNLEAEDEGYETSSVSEDSESEEEKMQKKKRKPPPKPVDKRLTIDIDLGLTPWANASQYYDQKKSAAVKEEKTVLASVKALKSTEKKVTADLMKGLKQEKDILRPVRKQNWFEKYMYFISSDGYLVLGGKDAQQNEILYRKYLKKGDVYVHADLHGAASVIIKNNPSTPDAPIPPSTLSQAGNLSVATSDAWDSKAVMSAWWVNSDQVSKTAPTGEYLVPGGFMIRGKKNFLPPAQLVLGFAVMFQISEESKAKHVKHRLLDEGASERAANAGAAEFQAKQDKEEAMEATSESGSDEDFPDAKLESASEESDGESDRENHGNPLQSARVLQTAQSGQDSDAEETHEASEMKGVEAQESEPQESEPRVDTAGSPSDGDPEPAPSVASSAQTQEKSGRRHLSARERRLLRKGETPGPTPNTSNPPSIQGPATDDEEANSEADETASKVNAPSKRSQTSKPPGNANKGLLPRGKRTKVKKLATKYADQDEEDRALALRLLGSKAGQEAAEAQAQARISKEKEALAQKQRRREQHLRTQALGRATEEARRAVLEGEVGEGEEVIDEEAARLELVGLDSFIGRPLPGDELLTAIPVCAPWSALAAYKYKVKLQPGVTKKGKAVKEILSRWDAAGKDPRALDKKSEDVERVWPREIELIKNWKEAEIYGVVPVGKVRIMMAGGSGTGSAGGAAKAKGKSSRGGRGSKKK
ncbi:hypothetical protein K432DRAFT_427460 [Lepidopterella palustris CBS 459.81]|uniref:Ribosome quality control complex subunit 2 n=1 Tax=Lepidopterella palustris CBS 459.81 TaxID=1314670 RepID=A0A8E2JDL3_9PEZI|nr:hypothetical protein K432DRAFT_427460 [Lepidopterella palustris CBS 459.81]